MKPRGTRGSTSPTLSIAAAGEVITGATPSTARRDYYGGSIPFVTPADLDADAPITSTKQTLTDAGAAAARLARPGAVLVSCIGSIGKVGVAGVTVAFNQQINAVELDPARVDDRFGYHALRAQRLLLRSIAPSTTIAIVSKSRFSALSLPAPPLPEQRRIAGILDKADAIRRKRRDAIPLPELMLSAAFLAMFGAPIDNPMRWPLQSIDDLVERFEAGWSASGEPRRRSNDERGVLKVSAVTSGFFRPEEHKAVAVTEEGRALVSPRRGDLLFSRANTRELVAATCLVEEDEPALFLSDKLWRIVPRDRIATAPYLRYLLADPGVRAEIAGQATGSSSSMLNISMSKVRRLLVPVPPLAEQRRFAAIVQRGHALRRRLIRAHEDAERLADLLALRAFRGLQ